MGTYVDRPRPGPWLPDAMGRKAKYQPVQGLGNVRNVKRARTLRNRHYGTISLQLLGSLNNSCQLSRPATEPLSFHFESLITRYLLCSIIN